MEKTDINFKGKAWHFHLRDEADVSVAREIFKFGEYKKAEEAIKNAKGIILDVGAHAGFFAIYCRALGSKEKIFLLEPKKDNIEILEKNLKENKIIKVKIIKGALSGKTEKRQFCLGEDSHNGFLVSSENKNCGKKIEIETWSFFDFCKNNDIEKISVLKMDIEGGEYEVFKNMKKEDFSSVGFIVLEYHKGKDAGDDLAEMLRENGFGVSMFLSKFDKSMGFIFANNKRFKK